MQELHEKAVSGRFARMLNENAPEVFDVKHYVSIAELQVRK